MPRVTRTNRRFKLAPGLQEVLFTMAFDSHVERWTREIAASQFGEEARAVLVAIGWLSSGSDPRLSEIEEPTPIKATKPVAVP
jgi:hypothetical protein